jgi:hypothetical protein
MIRLGGCFTEVWEADERPPHPAEQIRYGEAGLLVGRANRVRCACCSGLGCPREPGLSRATRLVTLSQPVEDGACWSGELGVQGHALAVDLDGGRACGA